MKNIIKSTKTKAILAIAFAFCMAVLPSATVLANVDGGPSAGASSAHADSQPSVLFGDSGVFQTIVNVMLFVIGAVSVIMIVIGGFRYVISNGNKDSVESAKNTILYAIIGLLIAIFAYAIVQFVINSITPGSGSGLGGGGSL